MVTAGLALVALAAFALPAVASAATNPTLTEPTGTVLDPTGKTCTTGLPGICVTATNIGAWKFVIPGVVVECTTSTMTGGLSVNTVSSTQITIHTINFGGTGSGGACTTTFLGIVTIDTNIGNGIPWCLSSNSTMAADEFQMRGGACGNESHSMTFVLTTTQVGTCKYSRTAAIKGTYTTDTSPDSADAILHLKPSTSTEFTKEEGGVFCPATGQLEASYTLETDTTPSNDPLWFS
jgi:hypothetical protein